MIEFMYPAPWPQGLPRSFNSEVAKLSFKIVKLKNAQTWSRDYAMTKWAKIKFRVIFGNLKPCSFFAVRVIFALLHSFMV